MFFPGVALSRGEAPSDAVKLLQARLNELDCGPITVDGVYGEDTEIGVRLFQQRFAAPDGTVLKPDGVVGPLTWSTLFGVEVDTVAAGPDLAREVLRIAEEQIGVVENPANSNRGPEVETFLRAVGLGPGNPWCAAFVYWCVGQAVGGLNRANPLPRTGGVLELWRRAKQQGLECITADRCEAKPALLTAGMVFIMDFGGGKGHTGFVAGMAGGKLVTIEGNASNGGSREGTGVFRLTRRTVGSIGTGFIQLP